MSDKTCVVCKDKENTNNVLCDRCSRLITGTSVFNMVNNFGKLEDALAALTTERDTLKEALRLACDKIEGLGEFKLLSRMGIPPTVISSDGNPVKSIKAIQSHFLAQATPEGG